MKAIQKRRAMTGQSGFTLIELLVVIAILGVLAAVVVFAVGGITSSADESACKIDLRTLRTAVQAYRAENGAYPADEDALVPGFLEDPSDMYDYTGVDANDVPQYAAVSGGDCTAWAP